MLQLKKLRHPSLLLLLLLSPSLRLLVLLGLHLLHVHLHGQLVVPELLAQHFSLSWVLELHEVFIRLVVAIPSLCLGMVLRLDLSFVVFEVLLMVLIDHEVVWHLPCAILTLE